MKVYTLPDGIIMKGLIKLDGLQSVAVPAEIWNKLLDVVEAARDASVSAMWYAPDSAIYELEGTARAKLKKALEALEGDVK